MRLLSRRLSVRRNKHLALASEQRSDCPRFNYCDHQQSWIPSVVTHGCSGGCATSVAMLRGLQATGTQGDASNVDAVNPVAGRDSRPADCWFSTEDTSSAFVYRGQFTK